VGKRSIQYGHAGVNGSNEHVLNPEFLPDRVSFSRRATDGLALSKLTYCRAKIPFSIDLVSGFIFSMLSTLAKKIAISRALVFKMLPALQGGKLCVPDGHDVVSISWGKLRWENSIIKYLLTSRRSSVHLPARWARGPAQSPCLQRSLCSCRCQERNVRTLPEHVQSNP